MHFGPIDGAILESDCNPSSRSCPKAISPSNQGFRGGEDMELFTLIFPGSQHPFFFFLFSLFFFYSTSQPHRIHNGAEDVSQNTLAQCQALMLSRPIRQAARMHPLVTVNFDPR
jgi:hypothetical protein